MFRRFLAIFLGKWADDLFSGFPTPLHQEKAIPPALAIVLEWTTNIHAEE
jgi:hypothetical protein